MPGLVAFPGLVGLMGGAGGLPGAGAGAGAPVPALPAGFQMPTFGSKTQLRISGFPPTMTEQEVRVVEVPRGVFFKRTIMLRFTRSEGCSPYIFSKRKGYHESHMKGCALASHMLYSRATGTVSMVYPNQ